MKKKIIYLIFTVALVAVVVALSSAVQLVYAKYATESDAEQGVSFNFEAHKDSTDYSLKMVDGNASQHIKHWNCCDIDIYENHTFDSNSTCACGYIRHVHSYSKVENLSKAATCTAAGWDYMLCSCGDNYTTTVGALGHDYNSQTISDTYLCNAGTCQVEATYYYKCTRCAEKDTTKTFKGAKADHVYSTTTQKYLNTSATCQVTATYFCECKWCGAKGSNTYEYGSTLSHVAGTQLYQDSNGHFYKCVNGCNGEMNRSSHSGNYQSDGSQHWKNCSVCSYQMVGKTNHSGSYSSDGSKHWKKCSACDYTMVAETNHAGNFEYNGTQHWKKCSTCSYTMVSTATHTTTHAKNGGTNDNGAVSCSVCTFSVTPDIFYDGYTIGNKSSESVKKVGTDWTSDGIVSGIDRYDDNVTMKRGLWALLKTNSVLDGSCLDVVLNGKRYIVIEYGDVYAKDEGTTVRDGKTVTINPNYDAINKGTKTSLTCQYSVETTETITNMEFRNPNGLCDGKGLCVELLDLGLSAQVVRLYLWVQMVQIHVSNIAVFDDLNQALAYQDMLSCCADYPVYDCGYAVSDNSYATTNQNASRSIRSVANVHEDILGLAYPTSGYVIASVSDEVEVQSYTTGKFTSYRRARKKE